MAAAKAIDLPSVPYIGVDEVGRGCLWGEVVTAAVQMPTEYDPDDHLWREIKDSKKLSEKKRRVLSEYIQKVALTWGIGTASAQEIDEVNILRATMHGMHRALNQAWAKPGRTFEHILVDGPHFIPFLPPGIGEVNALPHTCIPQGDDQVLAISAASIIAKVYRDDSVVALAKARPEFEKYDLAKNKGYGTAKHMAALREHGPAEFHRHSFSPVAQAALAQATSASSSHSASA